VPGAHEGDIRHDHADGTEVIDEDLADDVVRRICMVMRVAIHATKHTNRIAVTV